MPLLAAWIGSLISSIAGFFAAWMSKQIAIRIAVIAALVAFTTTFVTAIRGILAALSYATPPQLSMALSWIVPTNVDVCLAAWASAAALRWAYDWNTKIIQMKII